MAVIRTLSEQAMREVAEVVRRVLGDSLSTVAPVTRNRQGLAIYVGQTDGSGLTARVGTTLGTGTVIIQNATSGLLSDRTDDSGANVTVTAKNLSLSPLGASTYGLFVQELTTGNIVYIADSAVHFKPLVRFIVATDALTTSNATNAATKTDQYGPGANNTTAAAGITITNTLTDVGGVYIFEGAVGKAGLADWDSGTTYIIKNMQC